MTAQWLSRLCGIDIETCAVSGVTVRIIACIKDPNIIEKIFTHLDAKVAEPEATRRPAAVPGTTAREPVRRDEMTPR